MGVASHDSPAALLAVVAFLPIPLWCWISWRGTKASAWGDPAVPESAAGAGRGWNGRGYFPFLVILAVFVKMAFTISVAQPAALPQFIMCWIAPVITLIFAWWRMGRPHGVPLNLLGIFFLNGASLGVFFALISEASATAFFELVSPDCNNSGTVHLQQPCLEIVGFMWIGGVGLVEETFKAIWLFYRFRKSSSDVPPRCLGCLPTSGCYGCNCGRWFLLAPTPYHVILCAMCAGSGFEIFENFLYVFAGKDLSDAESFNRSLATALARFFTSNLHLAWTGLIGLGLARKMFPRPGVDVPKPFLVAVVLPVAIMHGLYDFLLMALVATAEAMKPAEAYGDQDAVSRLVLGTWTCIFAVVFVWIGTFFLIIRGTGCRCCPARACCQKDFWGDGAVGAGGPQRPLLGF